MRNNHKTWMGAITVAAGLAVLASAGLQAAPPESASGDFVVEDLVVNSVEPKGETCHIELTARFRLEGTFNGSFDADFQIVHLGACGEPAKQIFVAQGTFTGEVDGEEGSFDFTFQGEIDEEGQAEGDLVIGRGTDDLADLSGRITLTGTAGVDGTYAGRIHFVP